MDFFTRVKNAFKAFNDKYNDTTWGDLTNGGKRTPLSSNVNPNNLIHNIKNWVYVSVDKVADTCARNDIVLKRINPDGTEQIIEDHPAYKLLEKPNKLMTGADLRYMQFGMLEVTGTAYLKVDKPVNPTEMLPINPTKITYVKNSDGIATAIKVDKEVIPLEQVIMFKYPSLKNPLKGGGTMEYITEWIDVDAGGVEYLLKFFVNGAMVSGILETEATTKEALELAKLGWEMRHQGLNNAHNTAVMPKGVKYNSVQTNKDMQLSDIEDRYRDKILSAFGVPKSVVGITEAGSSRADAEAKNYAFMEWTIKPKMRRYVDYLNAFYLPMFSKTEKLYFDFVDMTPDNEELKLAKYQAGLANGAWMTVNEVRAEQGLPPINNGDSVFGGFATVPIGTVQEQPKRLMAPQTKDETIGDKVANKFKGRFEEIMQEIADEEKHQKFIARVTPYEERYINSLVRLNDELQKEAIKNLPKAKQVYGKVKAFDDLFDKSSAIKTMIAFTDPVMQTLFREEGAKTSQELEHDGMFDPSKDEAQQRVREAVDLSAQSYNETTLSQLSESVAEGLKDGESLPKLTARVADVFEIANKQRAMMIARTVTFKIANAGAREAYKQSGVVKTVRWHTAEDERVCPYCAPLNGKVIDVNDTFFDEGDTVTGKDGSTFLVGFWDVEDPPLHNACRCFTLAEEISIKGVEKDNEIDRLEQLVKSLEEYEQETGVTTKGESATG